MIALTVVQAAINRVAGIMKTTAVLTVVQAVANHAVGIMKMIMVHLHRAQAAIAARVVNVTKKAVS